MLKMPANLVLLDLPGAVFVSNHSEKLPETRMSGTLAACLLRTWRSNENSCGARSPDTAASWRELGISITLTYATRSPTPRRGGRQASTLPRPASSWERLLLTAKPSIPSGDEGVAGNGPFPATTGISHGCDLGVRPTRVACECGVFPATSRRAARHPPGAILGILRRAPTRQLPIELGSESSEWLAGFCYAIRVGCSALRGRPGDAGVLGVSSTSSPRRAIR
jgi:hypothetical protein